MEDADRLDVLATLQGSILNTTKYKNIEKISIDTLCMYVNTFDITYAGDNQIIIHKSLLYMGYFLTNCPWLGKRQRKIGDRAHEYAIGNTNTNSEKKQTWIRTSTRGSWKIYNSFFKT